MKKYIHTNVSQFKLAFYNDEGENIILESNQQYEYHREISGAGLKCEEIEVEEKQIKNKRSDD